MKTFKQFNEESRAQLDEIAPLALIPAALKLGGMALTAYSAGSALNNLRKGKFKQAGLDALGAIPGGRVFKGIRALGGAKNLAKAGSFIQSANRYNLTGLTPNAYAKGVDKTFDVASKSVQKGFNTLTGKNKKSNQVQTAQNTTPKNLPGYNRKDAVKQYKDDIKPFDSNLNLSKKRKDAVKQYKQTTLGNAAKRGALGSSMPKMGSAAKIGAQTLKGGKKTS